MQCPNCSTPMYLNSDGKYWWCSNTNDTLNFNFNIMVEAPHTVRMYGRIQYGYDEMSFEKFEKLLKLKAFW